MTTDEAKKAGFRTDANGWATTWRILNTSEIRRLNSKVRGLDANDFPTRAKARESLRKRKMEEAKPSETPAEKDARIKALVDSYVDKGGPITKEQLTDEVRAWLSCNVSLYYGMHGSNGKTFGGSLLWSFDANHPSLINLDLGQAFWTRADAEHAKWLADMRSQTTPITPEQAKMLRETDNVFMLVGGVIQETKCVQAYVQDCINDNANIDYYFTLAAAQAALDKAKAEAEPLEWCERKNGEIPLWSDDWTCSSSIGLQEKATEWGWESKQTTNWISGTVVRVYTEDVKVGLKVSDGILRARYRNPLWLAKHGNKDMIYNNNTDKCEPEPTKSLDDFPINKEEPTYSTEMHSNTEDLTLQTSLVLNHERGKTPSKLISFSNYKGVIPDRFTLDMKNFNLPALQGLINTNFVPMFRGQAKEVVTNETQPKDSSDAVSHPSHYTSHPSGVECITITKHMNFCRGNAVKYLWRAGQKGDSFEKEIEDIAKAEEYCRIEKERLIAKKGAK